MKKIDCLVLFFLLIFFASCGKMPINGTLDGMWHLTDIDYTDGVSTNVAEKQLYYSFQLHLISLRNIQSNKEYLGRFIHSGDSLIINEFRIKEDESKLVTTEELKPFGLNSTNTRFAVEELNKNIMILKSDYGRLYFKKF